MSEHSKIEWTDATWNPVRGCSLISDGCTHCYAMKQAHRFSGPDKAYEGLTELGPDGPRWNGNITLVESELDKPLRWKRPRKIFVNSMSDLFHEDVPDEFMEEVWARMVVCDRHIFIILTKRPERMYKFLAAQDWNRVSKRVVKIEPFAAAKTLDRKKRGQRIFQNVWLGVSVENQKTADDRIPPLLECPAAVRFVSYEPALGPVDLTNLSVQTHGGIEQWDALDKVDAGDAEPPAPDTVLDWVIAGGESGPGARPSHPDWFRQVRDDCQAAGVPFFFKQWGEWGEIHPTFGENLGGLMRRGTVRIVKAVGENNGRLEKDDVFMRRVGKKGTGDLLDGRQYHQFP